MINVHPDAYRLLYIALAVFGAELLATPAMLLSDDVTASDETSRHVLLAFGAVGAVGALTLLYALRRLLWPLRRPPEA